MEIAKESYKASEEFLRGREDLHGIDIQKEWRLLLTKSEIQTCVEHCAHVIQEKFRGKDLVIVCILKGCVYFLVDLTRQLTILHSIYMVEASSYHEQKQDKVEILSLIKPDKFKNKDAVVILDELEDNGDTLQAVKEHVMVEGNVPEDKIFTCVLFKKNHETNQPDVNLHGILVPDVWCVGTGLDSNQHLRNWECLYACPKLPGIPKSEADKIFEDDEYYGKEREKLLQVCNNYHSDMLKRKNFY